MSLYELPQGKYTDLEGNIFYTRGFNPQAKFVDMFFYNKKGKLVYFLFTRFDPGRHLAYEVIGSEWPGRHLFHSSEFVNEVIQECEQEPARLISTNFYRFIKEIKK